MIEEKLEILLITYNRAKDLENTFKQLLKSPFVNCKFTVLDNCSTDGTPKICSKYKKLFTDMMVIRHPKNIGANPNILRAVETSKSIYTWILCDDDNYSFNDCNDVIDKIESEEKDIILVSGHYMDGWERGQETTPKRLLDNGSKYFLTLSFVPSLIFKTSLFDSYCLHQGYFNVHNLYPHFPFIVKSYEEDFKIYVSKKEIVKVGKNNIAVFSNLVWLISLMKSFYLIKDKYTRKKAIYFFSDSFILAVGTIFFAIAIQKLNNDKIRKDVWLLMNTFFFNYGFSKEQLLLVVILIISIIPSFIIKLILKLIIFIDKRPQLKSEIKNIMTKNYIQETDTLRK
jgi:glycosyltransferase involved in cell wall biosynthesis